MFFFGIIPTQIAIYILDLIAAISVNDFFFFFNITFTFLKINLKMISQLCIRTYWHSN